MPVRRRRLQAGHEQHARDRELAKQLQDKYDIEATTHEGLMVNR